MDGQPFFFVHKDVSSGLIDALETDIVPRLLKDVPDQPSMDMLESDPRLHRFSIIFDREGYSPALLLRLKEMRIACLTYHKFPKEDWSTKEFKQYTVTLPSGQEVEMKLAEREIFLGKLYVREIRRLTSTGHQTSIIATDFKSDLTRIAVRMFARWSQENFFKYARENFNLDRLVEYGVEEIPEAENVKVVNPEYRRLDQEVRKEQVQAPTVLQNCPGLHVEVKAIRGRPEDGASIMLCLNGNRGYVVEAVGKKSWLQSKAVNSFITSFAMTQPVTGSTYQWQDGFGNWQTEPVVNWATNWHDRHQIINRQ